MAKKKGAVALGNNTPLLQHSITPVFSLYTMSEQTTQYRQAVEHLTFVSLIVLITLVVGIGAWSIYYFSHFPGLNTVDVMDQAQVARHLHLGRGLTTGFLKPLTVKRMEDSAINPPDLYNSPLPVIILSLSYRVFGISDDAVIANSFFWTFLAAVLLLILARLLFRNPILPLIVFFICCLNPGVLEFVFSGLPIALNSFLLLLFILCFYRRKRSSLTWTILLGAMTALLHLTEFDFLLLTLPLAVIVSLDSNEKKGLHLLLFIGAFILVSLPWLIRNTVVAGNPVSSLRWLDFKSYTLLLPGNRVMRDFNLAPAALSLPFSAFRAKFMMFSRLMYRLWLTLTQTPLLPLFFLGAFLTYPDKSWQRTIRMIVIIFFFQVFLIAAGNGDISRILIFAPPVIIGGVAAFLRMLDSYILKRKIYWAVIGGFSFLCVYPGLIALPYGLTGQRYISPAFNRSELQNLKESGNMDKVRNLSKDDEVIVSDIPWAIAWYGYRNSLWIPWEVEQMKPIKKNLPNIRFLYLSPVLFQYPESENVGGWREIYSTGMVPEWLDVERGILLPGENLLMGDIILERLDLE